MKRVCMMRLLLLFLLALAVAVPMASAAAKKGRKVRGKKGAYRKAKPFLPKAKPKPKAKARIRQQKSPVVSKELLHACTMIAEGRAQHIPPQVKMAAEHQAKMKRK